jgi:hypothetical protein
LVSKVVRSMALSPPISGKVGLSQRTARAVSRLLPQLNAALETRPDGNASGSCIGVHSVFCGKSSLSVWASLSGGQCLVSRLDMAAAHGCGYSSFLLPRLALGQRCPTDSQSTLWVSAESTPSRHWLHACVPSHQSKNLTLQRLAGDPVAEATVS